MPAAQVAGGIFDYPFMVNAFRAGAIAAVLAGALGWFMVVRGQTFAGHTLSVVGFPGAAGAALVGAPQAAGFFVFCLGAAVVVAVLPGTAARGRFNVESAGIGTLQALLLATGFLFVSLYAGNLSGLNALLFGSFLGITAGQVTMLFAVAIACVAALAAIARPLLFASLNGDVAAAAGLPTRLISVLFLLLLGAAIAETSQITGSLLVFSLLVAPAAAAQRFSARPSRSIALSIAIAVAVTWLGLAAAYYSNYPTGLFITAFAFAIYVAARGWDAARHRARRPGA